MYSTSLLFMISVFMLTTVVYAYCTGIRLATYSLGFGRGGGARSRGKGQAWGGVVQVRWGSGPLLLPYRGVCRHLQ